MAERVIATRVSEEAGLCKLIRYVCNEGKTAREKSSDEIDISALFDKGAEKYGAFISSEISGSESSIGDALDRLDAFLLEPAVKEHIRHLLEDIRTARNNLLSDLNRKNKLFPDKFQAQAYMEKYHQLIEGLFLQADAFRDHSELGQSFLLNVLNMDISFEKNNMRASLWCPAAIDALLHIYYCVEEYLDVVSTWHLDQAEAELLESNYQAVIISKALRFFRWIVVYDGKLYQAAVPAAIPIGNNEDDADKRIWSLDIPVRDLKDYNSYEGIGELRLFDKIVYELERRKQDKSKKLRILLIGDLLERPLEVLCQAVEMWLKRKQVEKADEKGTYLHISIFTYNKWKDKRYSEKDIVSVTQHISCSRITYNHQLVNGNYLNQLIEDNDCMFILDSCDLYNEIYVQEEEKNVLRHQLEESSRSSITNQQQVLYALSLMGSCGVFLKDINQTLLQYLGRQLQRGGTSGKTAYIYISDLNAISGLDYSDQYFIRVERYNEKEFLILRMPGMDEDALPDQCDRKIIVLNLWQVIKHATVRNIDCFMKYFGLEEISKSIGIFRDTLIGVEYEDWHNQLKFYYCIPQNTQLFNLKNYEKRLTSWIQIGIMPYFQTQEENMFNNYFVKAFSSFLYSDAKSVDDMLFLHLFVNKHHLLKSVVFAGKDDTLSNYQSIRCKYSQKQFYFDAMEDYDTSSEMFMYKYRKLDLMERADSDLRGKIFKKIIAACSRNEYEDSYLQINCRKMI